MLPISASENIHHRGQHVVDTLEFLEGLFQCRTVHGRVGRPFERRFRMAAEARERGSQVVRDVVERIPHAANQRLEPGEQLIEERRHFAQRIAGLLHRDTSPDVAGPQNALDCVRQRAERRQRRVGEHRAAGRRGEQDHRQNQHGPCAKSVERTTPARAALPDLVCAFHPTGTGRRRRVWPGRLRAPARSSRQCRDRDRRGPPDPCRSSPRGT